MDPLTVKFNLSTIHCFDEGDGPGDAEPYLWTIFFKIDGDTVTVNNQLKLQGKATVVTTPGNHGNLGTTDVDVGANVSIPASLGRFQTLLRPIPVTPVPGTTVGGIIGCFAILMEEDSTPDDAIAKGHQALNKAVADALNGLIPQLGLTKSTVGQADIDQFESKISSAVRSAVADNVTFWDAAWGFLSLGNNQDEQIGTAKFFFTHGELEKSLGTPVPLNQQWNNEGKWSLKGTLVAGTRKYDAVWRPGDSGEFQSYGMKFADYQAQYDKLWKQNYRIHLLNNYRENGQRLYDAVWRPGNTAETQHYGLNPADLQSQYDALWKQNMRLYLLNTYHEGGQRLYDAIWRPGTTGEVQKYALTPGGLQTEYDKLWKQNYRIYLLNTYHENGQRLYDAVWRPGTTAEVQHYALKPVDFQAAYDKLWKQNMRLYLLNTYHENGQLLYDAVWRPGTGGEVQFYGLGRSDLQAKYDALWKTHSRIEILNTYQSTGDEA